MSVKTNQVYRHVSDGVARELRVLRVDDSGYAVCESKVVDASPLSRIMGAERQTWISADCLLHSGRYRLLRQE